MLNPEMDTTMRVSLSFNRGNRVTLPPHAGRIGDVLDYVIETYYKVLKGLRDRGKMMQESLLY